MHVILDVPEELYADAVTEATNIGSTPEEVLARRLVSQMSMGAVHPNRDAMLREQEAFNQMAASIREKYLGLTVAVYRGEIVDHDDDEITLAERIEDRYPDQTVLIRRVTADSPQDIYVPSFRWEG